MSAEQPTLVPLPDLPVLVHGIVSLTPPTIQCDGCGVTHSGLDAGLVILTSGIQFGLSHPNLRLCRDCRITITNTKEVR